MNKVNKRSQLVYHCSVYVLYHLLNYPSVKLSNWKSKCPFSDLVTRDHLVGVSFSRSGACVTGLIAMSYDESSKSVWLSLLNPEGF